LDTSRVSFGEMIAAAGGLVLLFCMFLPWFDGTLSGRGASHVPVPTTTGWESFGGVFDILIVVLAAIPIGIAAGKANDSLPALPLEQGSLVLLAGVLLFAIIVLRVIDPPNVIDVAIPGLDLDTSRKLAGFGAALAAVAVGFGGYVQERERLLAARG
jgi:hypothetical protein